MAQLTNQEKIKQIEDSKKIHEYVCKDKGDCKLCKIFDDRLKALQQ